MSRVSFSWLLKSSVDGGWPSIVVGRAFLSYSPVRWRSGCLLFSSRDGSHLCKPIAQDPRRALPQHAFSRDPKTLKSVKKKCTITITIEKIHQLQLKPKRWRTNPSSQAITSSPSFARKEYYHNYSFSIFFFLYCMFLVSHI